MTAFGEKVGVLPWVLTTYVLVHFHMWRPSLIVESAPPVLLYSTGRDPLLPRRLLPAEISEEWIYLLGTSRLHTDLSLTVGTKQLHGVNALGAEH